MIPLSAPQSQKLDPTRRSEGRITMEVLYQLSYPGRFGQ
jgi:hypothetical protein